MGASFAVPRFSRAEVDRAGNILSRHVNSSERETDWATSVLANWRACHGYPMNTFQATLRAKLKRGYRQPIVAQRMKRAPSVISKLRRFPRMNLSRMQDIAGLRAVVSSVQQVDRLAADYAGSRLSGELVGAKDYIAEPKGDGYRCKHLVYRYENPRAPDYRGLRLELQIRSSRQHAWATAVETLGTMVGQALKAGEGEEAWRGFFAQSAAALSHVERTPSVPGFEGQSRLEVIAQLRDSDNDLHVLERLSGFAIAADHISTTDGQGAFHLIELNMDEHSVRITPYPRSQLEEANLEYARLERLAQDRDDFDVVLVAAGPVSELRRAYPNYFLDTTAFVREMRSLIKELEGR